MHQVVGNGPGSAMLDGLYRFGDPSAPNVRVGNHDDRRSAGMDRRHNGAGLLPGADAGEGLDHRPVVSPAGPLPCGGAMAAVAAEWDYDLDAGHGSNISDGSRDGSAVQNHDRNTAARASGPSAARIRP